MPIFLSGQTRRVHRGGSGMPCPLNRLAASQLALLIVPLVSGALPAGDHSSAGARSSQGAIRLCQAGDEASRQMALSHYATGLSHFDRGEFTEAIRSFTRA